MFIKNFRKPTTLQLNIAICLCDHALRKCKRVFSSYRALNQITIKFRYPLPLILAALEQLKGASVFTELDLRSVYSIIGIREEN